MEDQKAAEQETEVVAKLLDALPGLVGGIDRAIFEQAGIKAPFVLLVFAEGAALHATNLSPPEQAVQAIKQLAAHWDTQEPQAQPI